MVMERHGEDTQTLHAELLALLLAQEAARAWSHLSGSFHTKAIGNGEYVYFQYSDPGGTKRQFAIGPKSKAIEKIVAEYRTGRSEYEADRDRIHRLARLLVTAGQAKPSTAVARVLRALADGGVFRLGGVLVGTHAFALLGNMLGVAWPADAWRTEDVDVAGHVEIATPDIDADIPKALDSLQMGFVPVPAFDRRHPSTSFKVRGRQLRVDLLTPGSDRDKTPIAIRRFGAAAAPVKFLSLLLAEALPVPAVNGGATLVTVPAPARYALHKLLVSQTRSAEQQTKAGKDLHQAALLLAVLHADRPDDLDAACAAFREPGPAVVAKVVRAAKTLGKRWPDAGAAAAAVLDSLG